MNSLTFRSSRIIYYGPFACENCGAIICKMAHEFGGNAFTYPDGPIYPNTEWHAHVCDPSRVRQLTTMKSVSFDGPGPVPIGEIVAAALRGAI
jgi:hypothetical protein